MRYLKPLLGVAVIAAVVPVLLLWRPAGTKDGQTGGPQVVDESSQSTSAISVAQTAPPQLPEGEAEAAPDPAKPEAEKPERPSVKVPRVLADFRSPRRSAPPAGGVSPAADPAPGGPSSLAPAEPRAVATDEKDPGRIGNCHLTLIEEAEVPAQEAGVLKILATPVRGPDGKPLARDGQPVFQEVKEGMEVREGDFLAQVDDAQVQKAREVARYKLQAAEKEAGNDVNVRYAEAKSRVSQAEVEQAEATNRKADGAITPFELRRLRLSWAEAYLQIEQATHEMSIAKLKAGVSKGELDAAEEDIERRKIKSPLTGMVVRRHRHKGEWVRPGDPVFHVVRLDRLRIQAFLDADKIAPAEVDGQPVTATVMLPHDPKGLTFPGKIVFYNPIIESDGRFLVFAEVENKQDPQGHWVLRPGQKAELRIQLRGS